MWLRPVAGVLTRGAFLRRWRLMAIDGFELDALDTPANAAAFGYSAGARERPAFPKVRVVTIGECGSHAKVAAQMGPVGGKGSSQQAHTHYAIAALICRAATEADIDPDRVKFLRTVRIIRRRAADPAFPPDQARRSLAALINDLTRPRNLNPPGGTAPTPALSAEPGTTPTESNGHATPAPATPDRQPSSWSTCQPRP